MMNSKVAEIVRSRLMGNSVAKIAEDLGVSRQYVYNVLDRLPRNNHLSLAQRTREPALTAVEEYNVVMEYLSRIPATQGYKGKFEPDGVETAVKETAASMGIDRELIYKTLWRVTSYHPTVFDYPYYSNIERWKKRRLIPMQSFARQTGYSNTRLNAVLKCWEHMPLSMAEKIRDVTGLSLREIYQDLLILDAERENEATAKA